MGNTPYKLLYYVRLPSLFSLPAAARPVPYRPDSTSQSRHTDHAKTSSWKPFFTIPQGYYALVTKHGADMNHDGSVSH